VFDAKTHAIIAELDWAIARYKWCIAEWRHQAANLNDDGDSNRFYEWVVTPAREECSRLREELRDTRSIAD
jgi:hypothetical protein